MALFGRFPVSEDRKTAGVPPISTAILRLNLGDEESLRGRVTTGALTGQMLMRGSTSRTRQQIQDELAGLRAQMTLGGGPTVATAAIQTTRENLPAVLQLAIDVLRHPVFPESELETLRQQMISNAESQRSEPQPIVTRAI